MPGHEEKSMSRRRFMGAMLAGGSALGMGRLWAQTSADEAGKKGDAQENERVLRFAHVTDVHMISGRRSSEGFAACLKHVQEQKDRPELIIMGGDAVMDSLKVDEAGVRQRWRLYREVMEQACRIPVKACLGNHDIWGWDKSKSRTTGEELLWGKLWALQELHMPQRYYAFEQAGWRFIVLDSNQTSREYLFYGRLDDEQFDWLEQTLKAVPTGQPVVVISHIPIYTQMQHMMRLLNRIGPTSYNPQLIHTDYQRIVELFDRYPQVKLCLSGHLHVLDRVQRGATTYICGGSVCGSWWLGDMHGCEEGYGLVDLYADGRFEYRYCPYGWQVDPEDVRAVTGDRCV